MTVNFPCSHCNNLMAVGLNLLGRNVRCPTCKQVVQAPSAAPTSAPPAPPPKAPEIDLFPATTIQKSDEPDSIFGEQHDDDLFGTRAPKVELPATGNPPTPLPPPPPPPRTVPLYSPPPQPLNPAPALAPTVQVQVEEVPASSDAPWMNGASSLATNSRTPLPSPKLSARASARQPAQSSANSGAFVWILLLYALLVTGGGGYLLYDKLTSGQKPDNPPQSSTLPFKTLPDLYGQYSTASRNKIAMIEGLPPIDAEVPPELRVKLGQPITLGQLEVTPTKIEHQSILRYKQEKGKDAVATNYTTNSVYILRMKVKNVSEDVYFHPNDPAFNRRWVEEAGRGQEPSVPPYTGMAIDGVNFPGGPFRWPPTNTSLEREFVEGQQKDAETLRPKQERETLICTDFDQTQTRKLVAAITKHRSDFKTMNNPLYWRVQLRTGLQKEMGSDGQEHEVPITSVFAVEFLEQDIK